MAKNVDEAMKGDDVREKVSEAYTEALRRSTAGAGGCCSSPVAPAGAAAQLAGYSTELEAHAQAGRSSFGCGNPLAFARVEPGETVVDLGSGAGLDLLIAADKVGPHGKVIGVDMTDDMIAAARKNAADAGHDQVEVRKGTIESLPLEDASVDWVISNCVVNLSPEKERVFAEIHRVLKPGGRFSISDIVAEELPREVRELAAAYSACIAGAVSEEEYVAGLRAAGLEELEVSERLVYAADQLCSLASTDLEWAGEDPTVLTRHAPALEGKVASIRLSGRRPF